MMVCTEKKNSHSTTEKEKIATITDWHTIDWKRAERQVGILQKKITDAQELKAYRRVKRLQYVLSHSFYAKALAVRQVTSNKGKRTAGIDGRVWSTAKQKLQAVTTLNQGRYHAKPLRRIYIPKGDKQDQQRPLSIPTFYDRAMQKLYAYGFEPISELHADAYSYGFRKYRSTQDAITRLHICLSSKHSPRYILDADIAGCFDNISHDWILKNVPLPQTILRQWLKAGYMEEHQLYETNQGVPQGGIISPMITNYVLDGLLAYIQEYLKLGYNGKYTKASLYDAKGNQIKPYAKRTEMAKVNLIRYADDLVCTAKYQEEIPFIKEAIQEFLQERGLTLHPTKTQAVTIEEGFDFLGWNIRKYKGKLLIKPRKKSVQKLKRTIKEVFRKHRSHKQAALIYELNPILRGWANYYRTHVSSKTFTAIDSYIWKSTQKWIKRRHPNKTLTWGNEKYFCTIDKDRWVFGSKQMYLIKLRKTKIVRHHLIAGSLNYFKEPEKFQKYQATSTLQNRLNHAKMYYLYHREKGICPYCKVKIEDHLFDIHHIKPKGEKGCNQWHNLILMHRNCHKTIHARKERIVQLPNGQWFVQRVQ